MARKKEFNPQKALHQAMLVFWRQGYDATSIDDLCHAMGIKRGSLYDTFKDKRSLFIQVLHHYVQINYPQNLLLPDDVSPMESLRSMIQSIVEDAINDEVQCGCLLVNTITELNTIDPEITNFCATNSNRLVHTFTELLKAAQEQGEISTKHNTEIKAQFLVNALHGFRISSMITQERNVLEGIMNETLTALY